MQYRIWAMLGWMGCGSAPSVPVEGAPEPSPTTQTTPKPAISQASAPAVDANGLRALSSDLQGLTLGEAKGRPVLIALHGRGDHPQRFVRQASAWSDVAHVVVPAATIPFGSGFSWFDIRAAQDDPSLAAAVGEATRRVVQLVHARRPDGHPVVVTGFSQGGMLSFALATRGEKVVDAAVPMGGFLPRDLWPTTLPAHETPIFAVHGEADTIIPVSMPQQTVAHLETLGWPVKLYTEPGVEHSISRGMFREVDQAIRAGLTPE